MDTKSILGYSRHSPYKSDPFIDIFTPGGLIDMSSTDIDLIGIDNKGNKKKMKAGTKNPYKFEGDIVREIPVNPYKQMGGINQIFQEIFGDDEDEMEEDILPIEEEQIEEKDILAHEKAERLAFERMEEEMAMMEATRGFDSPSGRDHMDEEWEIDNEESYTSSLSSGKWGNQNIGQHGKKIVSDITSALGYQPTFNSIFRDKQQQQQLIKSGAPAAKNSYHLTGDAVDMKPADWNRLTPEKQQYFRKNYDVIYHNNHYHIEPK